MCDFGCVYFSRSHFNQKTPLSKPQNKDGTPTQLNNNIGTNLLEKFAQSEDLTR